MQTNKWKVIAVYKELYKLSQDGNFLTTRVTGNFYNNVKSKSDFPSVGDWVYLNGGGLIEIVDERKSQLSRKTAGKKHEEQILAANVDIMFIVSSLNKEFNINKIGRYIILAETNHIVPILLLTKLDLCDNPKSYIQKVHFFYPKIETELVSAFDNIGIESIYKRMGRGCSAVFVGASGVGKSTLVNKLLGNNQIRTSSIREKDDKGRHTTTHRELFELANGSFVIDTPGIREIGLWINETTFTEYQDIYLLSRACKYRNCQHINENDCAVKRAIELGDLSKERYNSFIKMTHEIYYSKLGQDEGERLRFKSKVKRQCKNERYTRR